MSNTRIIVERTEVGWVASVGDDSDLRGYGDSPEEAVRRLTRNYREVLGARFTVDELRALVAPLVAKLYFPEETSNV